MEGGAESGFSHVAPEEYEARLFKFVKEQRNVVVRQVSLKKTTCSSAALNSINQHAACMIF